MAMIIVNNGMIKSGSSLLMHYTKDIIRKTFPQNANKALRDCTKRGALAGSAQFVANPGADELNFIECLAKEHGPVAVKIHSEMTPVLIAALREKRIFMTTTFRDPRDMILSAIDHANRSRKENNPMFQEFTNVAESIRYARWWAQITLDWINSGLCFTCRYEHLVADPLRVLESLCQHIGISVPRTTLEQVIESERCSRAPQFNTGKAIRFKTEMTSEEIALCDTMMGDLIEALGYQRGTIVK